MTWRRAAALAALLVGATADPTPVVAQSPGQRLALQQLRDSLEFTSDLATLRALEAATIDVARRHRDDPIVHLRLGLIALRLHALDTQPHADDAISEFEWAASLRPEWPWSWFGVGLAESVLKDRSVQFAGGLWFMLGLDRESRAGVAYARAIAADPSFVNGLLALAQTALAQRINAPLVDALDALRAATASPIGWHPDLLLERGRLERLAGDPDSAIVVFRRALLLGRRTELAWLELARSIPLGTGASNDAPVVAGSPLETAYVTGATSDHPETVAMYRRDLEPILADSELVAFDASHGQARAAWLREFWRGRDAVDLRSHGSRLAEHFRRWAVVRREFRLPPFRRHYRFGVELYRSGDGELDDRGIIWLRHGAPTVRIEWPRSRSRPGRPRDGRLHDGPNFGNESWRYDRPDGALVLHFVAEEDPQDFRVVDSPDRLDVPGDLLAARAHELPGVARLLRINQESPAWGWVSEEVRQRGLRSIALATQTDSWERTYPTRLTGHAQWFAAGVRDGQPLLHLVYAIDAATIRGLPGGDANGGVPIRVRAVALTRDGVPVAELDTVQFAPRPGPGVRFIAMRAEMPTASGVIRLRLGVEVSPAIGAVYPVDSLTVPDISADSLTMSALLTGSPARSLPWLPLNADTAWLDAGTVYRPTDTLVVYAEAYGVRRGTPATVRLVVTRAREGLARLIGRERTAIALTERLELAAPRAQIRRALALSELAPGTYTVELTVTQGNRSLTRRRGLVIR